jgi:hypothetical protein
MATGLNSLSLRPAAIAYASRGVSLRQHSIILCSFAYNFISNLHQLHEIASSSPPSYASTWPIQVQIPALIPAQNPPINPLSLRSVKLLTHLEFRIELYCKLLNYSTKGKL